MGCDEAVFLMSKGYAVFANQTRTKGNTMIAIEEKRELNVHSGYEMEFGEAELSVERTDISFQDVAGDKVRIQVTVRNTGTRSSRPMPMRLESAPLGAFVPWRPLAQLMVPVLEPGESREMSIEVDRPRPTPLGDFDRVPPKKLLTAVNSADESSDEPPAPRANAGLTNWINLMRRRQKVASGKAPSRTSVLAPDLWDLAGRGQPYWAGNINVFIGRKAVERHRAQALRIYPGRTNMAMFMVGGRGGRDGFSFGLAGLNGEWKTKLYEATNNRDLVINSSDAPI
jgi:hypothetical protein